MPLLAPTPARHDAESERSARRRPGLTAAAAAVAVSAYGGAIGLVTGGLTLGGDLDRRLPGHSPVLGGVALALIVGVPCTVLAVASWRRWARTDAVAIGTGALLVAWIAVEYGFIRTFSFFLPIYVAAGAAFIAAGWPPRRRGAGRDDQVL